MSEKFFRIKFLTTKQIFLICLYMINLNDKLNNTKELINYECVRYNYKQENNKKIFTETYIKRDS